MKKIETEIQLPFDTIEFKEEWRQWLKYRSERRLPKYTPTGLQKTFTHLKNISEQSEAKAILIIEQSIVQSYQGLFPLKNNNNGTNYKQTSNPQHDQLNDIYAKVARSVAEG